MPLLRTGNMRILSMSLWGRRDHKDRHSHTVRVATNLLQEGNILIVSKA